MGKIAALCVLLAGLVACDDGAAAVGGPDGGAAQDLLYPAPGRWAWGPEEPPPQDCEAFPAALEAARARWAASGVGSYRLRLRVDADISPGTWESTVVDGAPVAWTAPGGQPLTTQGAPPEHLATVERLFAETEGLCGGVAYNRPHTTCGSRVVFDPELGVPRRVSVDCPAIFDDEVDLELEELVVGAPDCPLTCQRACVCARDPRGCLLDECAAEQPDDGPARWR